MHTLKRDVEQIFGLPQNEAVESARLAMQTLNVQIGNGARGADFFKARKFDSAANGLADYLVMAEKRMIAGADRKGEDDAIA